MTQAVFLALYAFACAGAFALGLRTFRAAQPPAGVTAAQAKRFGRLLMMAATAMALFAGALWLHGDLRLGRA